MQGGYEDDLVAFLQEVIAFPFQLPISVIDQDEDTRSPGIYIEYALKRRKSSGEQNRDPHCVIFEEKFLSLFEQILSQPMYQVVHIGWFAIGRYRWDIDRMRLLIREEKLEASAKLDSD